MSISRSKSNQNTVPKVFQKKVRMRCGTEDLKETERFECMSYFMERSMALGCSTKVFIVLEKRAIVAPSMTL